MLFLVLRTRDLLVRIPHWNTRDSLLLEATINCISLIAAIGLLIVATHLLFLDMVLYPRTHRLLFNVRSHFIFAHAIIWLRDRLCFLLASPSCILASTIVLDTPSLLLLPRIASLFPRHDYRSRASLASRSHLPPLDCRASMLSAPGRTFPFRTSVTA